MALGTLAAVGLGTAAVGLGGKIADAVKGKPAPYRVNRSEFDYDNLGASYRDRAQRTREGQVNRQYGQSRDLGMEPRADALSRIGNYRSQAEGLQRAGMEQARLQQMAAAASASPSTRAAAMRGASMNTAAAQQGIAGAARQHQLAEHQAQLAALAQMRQQDLGVAGLDLRDELQRQAFLLDKERVAQGYEGLSQADRQYEAQLRALAEQTQAGAYGANQAATAGPSPAAGLANTLMGMGGSMMTYGMLGGGGGQQSPPPGGVAWASGNQGSDYVGPIYK